ncbi:MAG: hypothetical protein GX050_05640 [Firmicutes bacterium]|nr:hypothetical protein [Bacillota bacterium]
MRSTRCLSFFCLALILLILTAFPAGATSDLLNHLPLGANIIQCFALPNFDKDPDVEYLVLYSLQENYALMMLDLIDGRYTQIFNYDLGRGDRKTKGKVKFGDTGYTYNILQIGDLDLDGVLEFWTLFRPEGVSHGELTMYKYRNNNYLQMFTARGQYDLQFMDYEGDLVIHEVNYLDGKPASQVLAITSKKWDLRDNRLKEEKQIYQIARREYANFARLRRRPQLFGMGEMESKTVLCWGTSLNKIAEIPSGKRAILPLLPSNASLLDWASDPALDDDIEEEYVFTYLLPTEDSPSKVLLLAAIADWDFERCAYQLTLLPFKAYGQARDPEGYLYKSFYILQGNGLNHLAFLGNGQELPSLKLSLFNNNGLYLEEVAVFNANWHLQLLERYENRVLSYRVITADQEKSTGRIKMKEWDSYPQGVYQEFGPFTCSTEKSLSIRDYKKQYYHIEEPIWSQSGYEYLLLQTFHQKINPFASQLPGTDFQGRIEDFIFKYLTPYRIHNWYVGDLDRNGEEEALLLIRTDDDLWGWPQYRVGLLTKEARFNFEEIGPILPSMGSGQPLSGVYLADINGNGGSEIIFLLREYDVRAKGERTRVELYGKQGTAWKKLHEIDFIYDDLRLFKLGDEIWLVGFAWEGQNRREGSVYEFLWKNGRFNYQQKRVVPNFNVYLETLAGRKEDILSDDYLIFPPPVRE